MAKAIVVGSGAGGCMAAKELAACGLDVTVLEAVGVPREKAFFGTLNAGHPGGCFPLTAAEAETLHHDALPDNLSIADTSLLPRSMGNPPILTIMALAKRVARLAAARAQ